MALPDPETLSHIGAGATGSMAAAWLAKTRGIEFVVTSTVGTAMAYFFSPGVAQYFGFATAEMKGATAFVVGTFGLNIIAAIAAYIKIADVGGFLPFGRKDKP